MGIARAIARQPEVMLIDELDIRDMAIATNDAGESLKDPQFSTTIERADGLIIVTPQYNHGYPGLLKHVLDTCLKE
ncbi:NADPH-dependent FMN reductase [Nostoc sp.]|uniref:NADPH-dependent FMN reductase n=2 Tax=unclassified Nostoc TaxID=2593658 RepID=UPI003FA5D3D9